MMKKIEAAVREDDNCDKDMILDLCGRIMETLQMAFESLTEKLQNVFKVTYEKQE